MNCGVKDLPLKIECHGVQEQTLQEPWILAGPDWRWVRPITSLFFSLCGKLIGTSQNNRKFDPDFQFRP
jgi:hypothetical protein